MVVDNQHWKPSPVFPDKYAVSDKGEVYSVTSRMILSPGKNAKGYLQYSLYKNGKHTTVKAHRLVAIAFIPNPDNKSEVDHINGDRQDNRVENLRWVTSKENARNPITYEKLCKNGIARMATVKRVKEKPITVYKNGLLVGEFKSGKEAAQYTGSFPQNISNCLKGRIKTSKGYTFKFVDVKI